VHTDAAYLDRDSRLEWLPLNQARQFGIAHGQLGGSKIIITEDKNPVLVGVGEKQISLGPHGMEESTIADLLENDVRSLQEIKQSTVRVPEPARRLG
jgi:hypothetical protein